MIKVSVLYPSGDDTTFNWDYYLSTHADMVGKAFTPHGLRDVEIDKGVSTDAAPPYVCMAHLYFDSMDQWVAASGDAGPVLGDIPNFTNATPTLQVSEVHSD